MRTNIEIDELEDGQLFSDLLGWSNKPSEWPSEIVIRKQTYRKQSPRVNFRAEEYAADYIRCEGNSIATVTVWRHK